MIEWNRVGLNKIILPEKKEKGVELEIFEIRPHIFLCFLSSFLASSYHKKFSSSLSLSLSIIIFFFTSISKSCKFLSLLLFFFSFLEISVFNLLLHFSILLSYLFVFFVPHLTLLNFTCTLL